MALAKVTIEALTQMTNTLRQSADDILATKEQMDSELYSIPWDDPIGLNFINRYEEDFKPLKEKLIPNIEQYLEYIRSLNVNLDAYSSDNGSASSGIGAATAAAGACLAGLSSDRTSHTQGGQPKPSNYTKYKKVDFFLTPNKDGTVSWDDERFKRLEKENDDFLKSKEGKEWKKSADKAFSKVNDLSSLTKGELHQIVGETMGLSKEDIKYDMQEDSNLNTLGWHPWDSKEAILNKNQKETMPICEQIGTFAHEGRHVYQDMVINDKANMSDYAKMMRKGRTNYVPASVDYMKYYNNETEKDARRFEVLFGKACTDRYNAIVEENKLVKERLAKPRVLHSMPN